jgi:chemotaxis protein methyltransferase CheR
LIVGSSELLHLSASSYTGVSAPDGIFYRKSASTASAQLPEATIVPHEGLASQVRDVAQPESVSSPDGSGGDDLRKKAATFYAQGRYAEAADAINALPPGLEHADVPCLLLLARCQANQGQLGAALDSCERAIAADRCNATSQYLRALILQEQGDTDQAIHTLRNVLFLDQQFILAHVALGTLARDRGQVPAARKHLHHALEYLQGVAPDATVLEFEDMTAGQLTHMIQALMEMEALQ